MRLLGRQCVDETLRPENAPDFSPRDGDFEVPQRTVRCHLPCPGDDSDVTPATAREGLTTIVRYSWLRALPRTNKTRPSQPLSGVLLYRPQRLQIRVKPKKAERFFRKGQPDQWKTELTQAQIDRIVSVHGKQMRRFGYRT